MLDAHSSLFVIVMGHKVLVVKSQLHPFLEMPAMVINKINNINHRKNTWMD
jgi:hypothetical protein